MEDELADFVLPDAGLLPALFRSGAVAVDAELLLDHAELQRAVLPAEGWLCSHWVDAATGVATLVTILS